MTTAYAPMVSRARLFAQSVSTRRTLLLAGSLIVAAYVATRVVFIARFPYFLDEGTYAQFTYEADHSIHKLFISLTIGREPLQIWLGIPLVKLGFNALTAMRLVSFGAGLLTIVPVALIARRLGGTAAAVAAAVICVLLPFFLVHDGIGIMEPLVTLIVATALLLSVELANRPDPRLGAVLGLVLGAGLLTKENTLPAAVLVPVGLVCFDWSPDGRRQRLKLWLGAVAIAALLVVAAELLLRSSSFYPLYVTARKTGLYTVRPLGTVLAHPFATWSTTWSVFSATFSGYVTAPLIALAALGAALALGRKQRLAIVLLIWLGSVLHGLDAVHRISVPTTRHVPDARSDRVHGLRVRGKRALGAKAAAEQAVRTDRGGRRSAFGWTGGDLRWPRPCPSGHCPLPRPRRFAVRHRNGRRSTLAGARGRDSPLRCGASPSSRRASHR